MKNLWKLTSQQKQEYLDKGYLVAKSPYLLELKSQIHEELRKICLGLINRNPKYSRHFPTLDARPFQEIFDWAIANEENSELSRSFYELFPTAPAVIAMVSDPQFLSLAHELGIAHPLASTLPALRIDRPVNNHWNTPVHQDVWFAMLSPNCATYWCPMLPITEDMGALWVIPGSHKLGILPIKRWDNHNPFTTVKEFPPSDFLPVLLKDDELLLFNQCLVHKSGDNRSQRARLTLQMRYNDLDTLEAPTTSFTVHWSKHVIEAQKRLLEKS